MDEEDFGEDEDEKKESKAKKSVKFERNEIKKSTQVLMQLVL
jgi:hypothetical protein